MSRQTRKTLSKRLRKTKAAREGLRLAAWRRRNDPAQARAREGEWEVVVGNVGSVYQGRDGERARGLFEEYRQLSWGRGRQRGEPVYLFKNGEIDDEYDPRG